MRIIKRIDAVLAEMRASPAASIPAPTKRKINAELAKGVTSGHPYARSFGAGLSAALDILAKYGIESGEATSPPLADSGSVRIQLAWTNKEDSFSPTAIENSVLVISFAKMTTGVEIVAYVS